MMPLTRMNDDVSRPMAKSPTWNCFSSGVIMPRTMYWSIWSTSSTKPSAHMGQAETRGGEIGVSRASADDGVAPRVAGASVSWCWWTGSGGGRVVAAAVLVAVAVVAALVIQRRRPAPPTQSRHWDVPAQLDRADFAGADLPWLVAVFTSSTCDSCERATAKAAVLASDLVAYEEIPYQSRKDLHERYNVEVVPLVVVAGDDGVV